MNNTTKIQKTVKYILFASICIGALRLSSHYLSDVISVNHTASLPGSIFLLQQLPNRIQRGSIVEFCPNEKITRIASILNLIVKNNKCPSGFEPFLKIVAAVPGDFVEANGSDEIRVNNVVFLGSKPQNPLLPVFIYKGIVSTNEYLLLTPHPRSFDSRYYGFIKREDLIKNAVCLF